MKRTLSLVLTLVLILSMVPGAFAAEDQLPSDIGSVGTAVNPAVLKELGWIEAKIPAANGSRYYTYTVERDGSIIFSIASIPTGAVGDIIVTNKTTGVTRRLSKDGVYSYSLDLTVNVKAKDVLLIQVTSSMATCVGWTAKFTATQGSQDNPIYPKWSWNKDYTEATAKVTVPVGTSYFAVNRPGMQLTVNGEDYGILVASGKEGDPAIFSITNSGKASATYQLKISWPVGAVANPDVLKMGGNTAAIHAGSQGYYYTWIAEEDGTLTVTMPSKGHWAYEIRNLNTGETTNEQRSDSKPVVNPIKVGVVAGHVLQIRVNSYDPKNPEKAPAAELKFEASFKATAEAPVDVLLGDVNGDTYINSIDAMMVLQYYVGFLTADKLNVAAGDVNGDELVNSIDAMLILQRYVAFIDKFPAE